MELIIRSALAFAERLHLGSNEPVYLYSIILSSSTKLVALCIELRSWQGWFYNTTHFKNE